jgi:hypothetical protein
MLKIILMVIALFILLFPVKVSCGAPGATCTTAPDKDGYIHRKYDMEPFFVMLIESVTQKDFFFKYYSRTESQLIKQ